MIFIQASAGLIKNVIMEFDIQIGLYCFVLCEHTGIWKLSLCVQSFNNPHHHSIQLVINCDVLLGLDWFSKTMSTTTATKRVSSYW